MLAQVINFTVESSNQVQLLSVIDDWRKSKGHALEGCSQIITCIDNDGFGHGTVVVLFDTQEALDKFSVDSEGQAFFTTASSHAVESLAYEADATVQNFRNT